MRHRCARKMGGRVRADDGFKANIPKNRRPRAGGDPIFVESGRRLAFNGQR
jgi:hypothetical protein